MKKISVVMSVFNAMTYLSYSLEAIYDFADEILICDGLIGQFNRDGTVRSSRGLSNDGTIEFVKSFPDPKKKIKFDKGVWELEKAKRHHIVERATGDWIMTVDADEVYHKKDLIHVRETVKRNPDIYSIWIHHYRFCGDFWHRYHWPCSVFQKKFKGHKLYGLREMWFPGKKTFRWPQRNCINVTDAEFKKHMWFPSEKEIICYHYSNVCTQEKAHRKRLISIGLGHDMNSWDKKQFGAGLNQKEYEKIRDIVRFKGEHPDVMKKHPYYKTPPEWMKKK